MISSHDQKSIARETKEAINYCLYIGRVEDCLGECKSSPIMCEVVLG